MFDIIFRYPIGSKIILDEEEHEVNGYKQIGKVNYILFRDGSIVAAEKLKNTPLVKYDL